MPVVLGIDAAWTSTQPSGVALAADGGSGWTLIAVEASYEHFHARDVGAVLPLGRPMGSVPNAEALLARSALLCGRPVDLVAIDMPLSRDRITGRRVSDNLISQAYGSRKCSTHSPSAERPGRISDDLRESFETLGYRLQTTTIASPGLIEVYPHPALVELTSAAERLPYKAAKSAKYWPTLSRQDRRLHLLAQWRDIVASLDPVIAGVAAALPELDASATGAALKGYEDKLDAVVCAWVAIQALAGQAASYGDEQSAIWIPSKPQ